MHGDQHPTKLALRQTREETIERLSDGFARDELSLEEFERRVDQAYAATSAAEARALVQDLSATQTPQLRVEVHPQPDAQAPLQVQAATAALATRTPHWLAYAVFGNVERHGRFAVKSGSRALAVFGNIELDLRNVSFPAGVTEIEIKAIFGNVEITVPPTIAVECDGATIFGSFESVGRLPVDHDGCPVLRITGKVIFGNVELHTLPKQAVPAQTELVRRRR